MRTLKVTAANGITFNIVDLAPGEHAAFPAAVRPERLIEIYDARYQHTPWGQFTTGRYYASTLLANDRLTRTGLDIHGGVPNWSIDAATWTQVDAWLREI